MSCLQVSSFHSQMVKYNSLLQWVNRAVFICMDIYIIHAQYHMHNILWIYDLWLIITKQKQPNGHAALKSVAPGSYSAHAQLPEDLLGEASPCDLALSSLSKIIGETKAQNTWIIEFEKWTERYWTCVIFLHQTYIFNFCRWQLLDIYIYKKEEHWIKRSVHHSCSSWATWAPKINIHSTLLPKAASNGALWRYLLGF